MADAAIVVVDAVAGVEVQTEKVWGYAEEYGIPRMIVVNRMDRERASFQRTLESLEKAFGRGVVPLVIPLGEEKGFVGVTDLLTEKADVYTDDQSGKYEAVEVPEHLRETEKTLRDRLVEMVAESNEELMEEFFEKGTLPQEDLLKGLRQAVLAGRIFPVFPASSLRNVGIQPILDDIVDLLPSPVDRGEVQGTDPVQKTEASRKPAADAPLSAFVFKTIVDPHAGRISLFRVYSGTLKADSHVHNTSRDVDERVGSIFLLEGKNQTPVAGDPGRGPRRGGQAQGDPDRRHPRRQGAARSSIPPSIFPEPATTFAIEPKTRGDDDKISAALHRLMEEDPVIRGCPATRRPTRCCSRAWASSTSRWWWGSSGSATRSRSTSRSRRSPTARRSRARPRGTGGTRSRPGGHGQFGDCKIRMKPLPRGADFKFVDDIFGGSIPKNFIPAVEKGIQDARLKGVVAGFPMVDFQVELFDGQYHDVDSSEMSFKIAGSLAFKDAMPKCRPTLLEPDDEGGDRGARGVRGRRDGRPLEPARPAPGDGAEGQPAGDPGRGAAVRDALATTPS